MRLKGGTKESCAESKDVRVVGVMRCFRMKRSDQECRECAGRWQAAAVRGGRAYCKLLLEMLAAAAVELARRCNVQMLPREASCGRQSIALQIAELVCDCIDTSSHTTVARGCTKLIVLLKQFFGSIHRRRYP